MNTIPVVDLSAVHSGNGVYDTAAALDKALRTVGFVQITGHGIDPAVFTAAYDAMTALMGESDDVRAALRDPSGHPFYGLVPRELDGRVVYHQFELNAHPSPDAARAAGIPEEYLSHFRTNLFPEHLEGFRAAMQGCFDAMRNFAPRLLALLAVAVGMPPTFFEKYMERESTSFGVGDYPHREWIPADTEILPWHTDRETLVNMLHQRGTYEGLEIRTLAGDVVRLPLVEDALAVNVGDLFERWTGGRWRGTPHHVVSGERGEWRQSIVTFCAPDVTRVIQPLDPAGGRIDPLAEPFNVFELALDLPRPVA